MTEFKEALARATGQLYEVEWIPEDLPLTSNLVKSYVVALSMSDAGRVLSDNPFDIKVVRHLGHVIVTTS